MEFRKSSKNLAENEFTYLDIFVSPHYHFNDYKHNGNDFSPQHSKQALQEIFSILEIQETEYQELQLINLEFGVNIISPIDIKNLITGILFYNRKTQFITSKDFSYYKITDATTHKQIKAYAKGLQFINNPEYKISQNTFRFEVRSKEAKNIRKYGIYSAKDLFSDEVYGVLGQNLLKEWEQLLIVNIEPDLEGLTLEEKKYLLEAKEIEFWIRKTQNDYRNAYSREVKKYYNKSQNRNNLHHQLKVQILDKIFKLLNGAVSTNKTMMNRAFLKTEKIPLPR
ncbi:hypothetical protein [Chryseobacterium sp. 'Rf worker isolate 10']|uniref:hypothetical protein n=1 Tax=Chryseobacterium sp. 'Rf worker isolate 10' TaxID=2887348 RepID=UPI003D6F098F